MTDRVDPMVIDLVGWIGAPVPSTDRPDVARLELRDTGLSDARTLVSCALRLVEGLLTHARPEVAAATTAGELHLVAAQLAELPEPFDGAEQLPALLSRAAVLCAGHEWGALGGVGSGLRVRLTEVDDAIAENAVQQARLRRRGPHLALAPTPSLVQLEEEERAVTEGLNQRAVLAGARSAFAAADAAFLPSLGDFLR